MPPRKKVAHNSMDDGPAVTATSPKPKKEGGRRNLRGKRGGLKDMPGMPLDILAEILRLLEPRDLLHLARTSKPFRELLMNRGSASMWKAARSNIEDLPDCPAHLSEPAYANLAFSPYCHSCFKPNVQTILWDFSARYCPSCLKANSVSYKDRHANQQYRWAFAWSYEAMFSTIRVNGRNELYHRPELDQIQLVRERLRDKMSEWKTFRDEQEKRVCAIYDHALLCHAWTKKRAASRSAERQDARQQRLITVVGKLRELGWGDELDGIAPDGYDPLCNHPSVKLSKPLADRAWLKIKDKVIAQMEDIKHERLRAERRKVLSNRLKLFRRVITAARTAPPKRTAADEYKPKCRDLAMMPEVRRLIEVPNDVVVDAQSLQVVVPMLPVLEERWQRERRADLARMLRDAHVKAQDGVDIVDLAVAVFQCKDCRRFLHHPHVLMHECATPPILRAQQNCQYADYYMCVFAACGSRAPWTESDYRVAPQLDRIRELVEMCGLDPKAATQKDMDAAGGKVVHNEPQLGDACMSWRYAVRFLHATLRRDLEITRWRVATEDDKAAVKEREEKQLKSTHESRLKYGSMRCGWCDIPRLDSWHDGFLPDEVKPHLRTTHGVEHPTLENGDYYLHPDSLSELGPIRINPSAYDAALRHAPWMNLDLDLSLDISGSEADW